MWNKPTSSHKWQGTLWSALGRLQVCAWWKSLVFCSRLLKWSLRSLTWKEITTAVTTTSPFSMGRKSMTPRGLGNTAETAPQRRWFCHAGNFTFYTQTSILWLPLSFILLSCVSLQASLLWWKPTPNSVPLRSQSNRRRLHWTLQVQTKEIPHHHNTSHYYHSASHHQAHT